MIKLHKTKTKVWLTKTEIYTEIEAKTKSKSKYILTKPRTLKAVRKGYFEKRFLSSITRQLKLWEEIESYSTKRVYKKRTTLKVDFPPGYNKVKKDKEGYYFYKDLYTFTIEADYIDTETLEKDKKLFRLDYKTMSKRDIFAKASRLFKQTYPSNYAVIGLKIKNTETPKLRFNFTWEDN